MRQSSLGVIQRVEARYRLAVGVGRGLLSSGVVRQLWHVSFR